MLIDDNESIREIIDKILTKNGFKAIIAKNTDEAQLLFNENKINLLISDIIMPKMSGQELAELLKSKNPYLKVLFIIGYDKYHADFSGKYMVLQKPFRAEELLRAILTRRLIDFYWFY